MDITPFLNRTLDIPLYQQLYRYFKENMHRGRIQKGMKLALTPGRQRAYTLYFSQAKQSKTRESRVEKYVQKILDGKGLKD